MLPVIQFSWRDFEPVVFTAARVSDLYEAALDAQPRLLIVHERTLRWTALAIPEVITQTVERFKLPGDLPADAVGLVDLIRQDQMTVHQDLSASVVAGLAVWQGAGVVHVVDGEGLPRGLFVPATVAVRLPEASLLQDRPTWLRAALDGSVEGLPDAIAAVEAELGEFHSEGLNALGPSPKLCEDHGLQHYIWEDDCPCGTHPDARCGPREIAARPAGAAAAATVTA